MSVVRSILIAALASASFAGVAYARADAVFTAKLAAPVAEQTRIIADSAVWTCSGDTCLARSSHAVSVRSCRQFVREAGAPVTSFGSPNEELSADELARCNGEAPSTQEARN